MEPQATRISVRGVLAGVVVALATAIVMLVLGAAIGLSALRPSQNVAAGVGIGFLVWLLVALCVSAFVGAWVAASVARAAVRRDGLLHGLTTWALVTLVGGMSFAGALSATVAGVFGLAGGAAQAAAASQALNQEAQRRDLQSQLGATLDQARGAITGREVREQARQATAGAAVGMWGLFLALVLPLACALGGGLAGMRGELRARGITVHKPRVGRGERTPLHPTASPPVPIT